MNISNQQRWRSLFRVRPLARYIRLNPILNSSSVNLSVSRLSSIHRFQPISKVAESVRSAIVFYILRDVPLHPHYDFQEFCSAIVWRLIQQYTRIAGDTS